MAIFLLALCSPWYNNQLASCSQRPYVMLRWCVCCCCIPRRARRCEPARRGVCERQTPSGCGEAADSGAGPPGRAALRHLQAAARQPRMRQQDPGQVGDRGNGAPGSGGPVVTGGGAWGQGNKSRNMVKYLIYWRFIKKKIKILYFVLFCYQTMLSLNLYC